MGKASVQFSIALDVSMYDYSERHRKQKGLSRPDVYKLGIKAMGSNRRKPVDSQRKGR